MLLGTSCGAFWEPYGNMMGTHWEQGKKKSPTPTPPRKEKNWTLCECMLSLLIG